MGSECVHVLIITIKPSKERLWKRVVDSRDSRFQLGIPWWCERRPGIYAVNNRCGNRKEKEGTELVVRMAEAHVMLLEHCPACTPFTRAAHGRVADCRAADGGLCE